MDELDDIRALLERYISPMIARSMLQRALRDRNLSEERYRPGDAHKISALLARGLTLFASDLDRDRALRELGELCERNEPTASSLHITLTSENDISVVRNEARR